MSVLAEVTQNVCVQTPGQCPPKKLQEMSRPSCISPWHKKRSMFDVADVRDNWIGVQPPLTKHVNPRRVPLSRDSSGATNVVPRSPSGSKRWQTSPPLLPHPISDVLSATNATHDCEVLAASRGGRTTFGTDLDRRHPRPRIAHLGAARTPTQLLQLAVVGKADASAPVGSLRCIAHGKCWTVGALSAPHVLAWAGCRRRAQPAMSG